MRCLFCRTDLDTVHGLVAHAVERPVHAVQLRSAEDAASIPSLHRPRLRPLWAAPEINQTRGYPLAPPMSICSGEQDEKASGGGSRLPANVG